MNQLEWKYAILIYLLAWPVNSVRAGQQDGGYAANSIFIQVLGKAGYGSVNYERLFLPEQNVSPGIRIGLGGYNMRDFTGALNPDLIMPVSVVAFYGSPHAAEVSAGMIFSSIVQVSQGVWKPERVYRSSASIGIGYRYMKKEGGVMLGIVYNPVLEFYERLVHWGGISVGFSF